MSARPAYPNAMVLLHPAMSAAQAEQVARDTGMEIEHDQATGNYSLRHMQKLEEARKRFGQPFVHEPGATWKPRATPVLIEWMQKGGHTPTNGEAA